jgi:hypothetical protein
MLNVSSWIEERKELDIQSFYVTNGADDVAAFEVMALTSDLSDLVKASGAYGEAVSLAAEMGISYFRQRASDDCDWELEFKVLFKHKDLVDIVGPTAKEQVGELICEISGLSGLLGELKRSESEAERLRIEQEGIRVIDGDNDKPVDPDLTLGMLEDDANVSLVATA